MCPIASGRGRCAASAWPSGAMCPIRPNVVWALDFQFDQTADGRMLKLLNVIDEYTREVPGHRRRALHRRRRGGAPASNAWPPSAVPRPTCASTTGPSSSPTPWPTGAGSTAPTPCSSTRGPRGRTPGSRSFNGRLRDEYLNGQLFDSLLEAQVLLEDWRIDYNINRPHSAHGWLTPVEFVEAWLNRQQLTLA